MRVLVGCTQLPGPLWIDFQAGVVRSRGLCVSPCSERSEPETTGFHMVLAFWAHSGLYFVKSLQPFLAYNLSCIMINIQ